MFTLNHYIPILKWKRAERRALESLADETRNYMTPLIELVMPTVVIYKKVNNKKIKKSQEEILLEVVNKFKQERIYEIPQEIKQSWGNRPVFLDFGLLYDAEKTDQFKINIISKIIPDCMNAGLKIIPVLNLNDNQKIKETIFGITKKYNQGFCLRIMPTDLSNALELNKKVETLIKASNLSRSNIDLLIDVKEIKEIGGKYLQFMDMSQKIVGLLEFRSFIFACGSFPEDLTECSFDEPTILPRFDWQNWLNNIVKRKLVRKPIFADYTIRNPIFNASLQYYNSTTSIKYTLENEWLILKGRVHKFKYYLANANLLVSTDYFCGEHYSWGDKNISQKARYYPQYIKNHLTNGTGTTEDWIAWCISHHFMSVVNKISSLP